MSDEILGVNQVLLSRNYRCANPVVEKINRVMDWLVKTVCTGCVFRVYICEN